MSRLVSLSTYVVVNGVFAYVACWISGASPNQIYGIRVYNTTTSALAQTFSYLYNLVTSMALQNNYLYVPENVTLHVYNATSPGALVASSSMTFASGSGEFHIAAAGEYAYIGSSQRLDVVYITGAPTIKKTFTIDNLVGGLCLWGNRCLVSDESGMVYGFDISDPPNTSLLYSREMPGTATGFATNESYAFIGTSTYPGVGTLQVVLDAGMYVKQIAKYRINGAGTFDPSVMALNGTYAYVTGMGTSSGVFGIYDVSIPSSPTQTAKITTPGAGGGIAVSGDYAYLTDTEAGYRGLHVVDIHDPAHPVIVSTLALAGIPYGIALYGDWVIVANDTSRLQFIDISDPLNPVLTSLSVQLAGVTVSPITIYGHMGYIAAGQYNRVLQCFDLQALGNTAATISQITMTPALVGPYAYARDLIGGVLGMYVTNVSDPFQPASIGFTKCSGLNSDGETYVSGGYAYSPSWAQGIQRFAIANPRSPSFLQVFPDSSYPDDLRIMGKYAVAILSQGPYNYLDVYQLAP